MFLTDLVVNLCSPGDAALTEMTLVISGLGEADPLEMVWSNMWKCNRIIPVHPGMGDLWLEIHSETTGALGHLVLTKEKLAEFASVEHGVKLECHHFITETNAPSLNIMFSIVPEEVNPMQSWNTGITLVKWFQSPSQVSSSDLNLAIAKMETAVTFTPSRHPHLPQRLKDLGSALQNRFLRTGDLADFRNAISNLQRAIQLSGEGLPLIFQLSNLANAFRRGFDHTRNPEDIENAVFNHQSALHLSELDPEGRTYTPAILNDLANSFNSRFKHTGNLADVNNAISSLERATQLTPENHPNFPTLFMTLGTSFRHRFVRTGELTDIQSAISNGQRAVHLTPIGHPSLPFRLSNLAISYTYRFQRTLDDADLGNAIASYQRAVPLIPAGSASLSPLLGNLGLSLNYRFRVSGAPEDIDNAISHIQTAIQLTPEHHANLPSFLLHLGDSFHCRFGLTHDPEDIGNAISKFQRAIQLTPQGHPIRPGCFKLLGTSFQAQFEQSGNLTDSENAIFNYNQAILLTPTGHSMLPLLFHDLGKSWYTRFQSTGKKDDIRNAITSFSSSATQTSGELLSRFNAAKTWAALSNQLDPPNTTEALEAFSIAIQLLSQIAGLEQIIHRRHINLIGKAGLTADATATAIAAGEIETALAWLEQGRCLVWNQINQLRNPVDDLRSCNPDLADRFFRAAHALDIFGSRQVRPNILPETTDMMPMIEAQAETQRHVELANEWNEILQQIRVLPAFHDFLQPPTTSSLIAGLPRDGHVVIFNIQEDRCDALALSWSANTPLHIPLASFSHRKAVELRDNLRACLKTHGIRDEGDDDVRDVIEEGARTPINIPFGSLPPGRTIIYDILRQLWEHVAKPILHALGYMNSKQPPNSERPRIWWCPTGPLAFLPIHAAGIYSATKIHSQACVSDFVVSSYTPSITTLPEKLRTKSQTPPSLLLISQPFTPGMARIPATIKETRILRDMMEESHIESLLIEGAEATTQRVTEQMNAHNWVHFACHAVQDQKDPLKSGVHLHNGRLELLEMMRLQFPDTDHAFMSACQTSKGDEKLSDEAVYIAAGMLAAGYRSVVATMWSIKDTYGPEIARCFYKHLLEDSLTQVGERRLDSARAAHALDSAIQKVRRRLGDTEEGLLTWVPYIHFGI